MADFDPDAWLAERQKAAAPPASPAPDFDPDAWLASRKKSSGGLAARDPEQQAPDPVAAYVSDYNRRFPNDHITEADLPEGRGLLGRPAALARGIYRGVVDTLPEGIARAVRGGEVGLRDADTWSNRVIAENQADAERRLPSKALLEGDKLAKALEEGPSSVATSVATGLGGAAVGGKIGATIGGTGGSVAGPGGTVAGGGAGGVIGAAVGAATLSGATFYRMAKDQFVQNVRDYAVQANPRLTEDDWKQIRDSIESDAMKYGLWEAGPEALSNALMAGIFKGGGALASKVPGIQNVMKGLAEGAYGKAASVGLRGAGLAGKGAAGVGGEIGTEFATYMGQGGIEQKRGLRETAPTWGEFQNEALPQVIGGAVLMGGGFAGLDAIQNRLGRKNAQQAQLQAPTEALSVEAAPIPLVPQTPAQAPVEAVPGEIEPAPAPGSVLAPEPTSLITGETIAPAPVEPVVPAVEQPVNQPDGGQQQPAENVEPVVGGVAQAEAPETPTATAASVAQPAAAGKQPWEMTAITREDGGILLSASAGGKEAGSAIITNLGDGVFELNELRVGEVFRRKGLGTELYRQAAIQVSELGGKLYTSPEMANAGTALKDSLDKDGHLGDNSRVKGAYRREVKPWADAALAKMGSTPQVTTQSEGVAPQTSPLSGEVAQPAPAPVTPPPAEPPAAPPGQQEPGPAPEGDERLVTPRHEDLQRKLAARGVDIPSPGRRSWEAALDQAVADGVHERAPSLIAESSANGAVWTDRESAGVLYYIVGLENALDVADARVQDANLSETERQLAANEVERLTADLIQADIAMYKSGTERGRALNAQKMALRRDYSFGRLAARARAKKGAPLTPDETETIKRMAAEIDALNKRIAEMEATRTAADVTEAVDGAKKRKPREPREVIQKEVDAKLAKIKELLAAGCARA